MLRVVAALTLFFLTLHACEGGFNSCVKKVKDSKSLVNNTLQIPISKHRRLVFSTTRPKGKILKYDPFLALYIVEDKKGFKYPFRINMREPSGIAAINKIAAVEGRIFKRQVGLNQFAYFKYKVKAPAVLTNSCCSLEGILTPKGVIEKVYIKRFIDKKDIRYSDIGIRVADTKNGVQVISYDPFMRNNPFKKGDYILAMDGKKARNSAELMRRILFAKVGSTHNVKVKRNGKILNIKVRTQKRLSGGYKVETYLEKYGLTFDKNLYIIKIDKTKNKYGLLRGDQLLQVNGIPVKNQKDVMKHVSNFKFHATLLFQRNANFQFFMNMD